MDLLLLGCYTKFYFLLIAKIAISFILPLYPFPPSFWMNELTNKGVSC